MNQYRALRAFHPMCADAFSFTVLQPPGGYLGESKALGIALGYGWFAGVELFVFMFYYGGAINHVAKLLNITLSRTA
jgi:hypothetical protein